MKLEIEVEFSEERAREDARRTENDIEQYLSELANTGMIESYSITEKIERC